MSYPPLANIPYPGYWHCCPSVFRQPKGNKQFTFTQNYILQGFVNIAGLYLIFDILYLMDEDVERKGYDVSAQDIYI